VRGVKFRVWGSGFGVQGSAFRVQGPGSRVRGVKLRVQSLGGGRGARLDIISQDASIKWFKNVNSPTKTSNY
jgi:hypothetical protein